MKWVYSAFPASCFARTSLGSWFSDVNVLRVGLVKLGLETTLWKFILQDCVDLFI